MRECIIEINDEVNCKISGLDADIRRKLVKMFEYELPGARYMPSVKLGRWNGKSNFFSLSGSTYINLLENIIPYLEQHGYDIELSDNREYRPAFTFGQITDKTFSNRVWPKNHPQCGTPIFLRDYQVQIITNFLENPQCIQEVATGAGKTLITAALSWSCESMGRTIVIVPNKSLITQTEEDYLNLGLDAGVYYGDRKEWGHKHTICTWQSLNVLLKNTRAGEADATHTIQDFISDVVAIIVDEVHMAKADALKAMLTGVMSHIPIRWGLTGTVPKEDFASKALFCSLGPVINKLSASELQDRGVLAQCHVNIVQLLDDRVFNNYQSELKYLLSDTKRLDTVAKLVNNIAKTGNTLVLVDRLEAGQALIDRIPDSVFVSGSTKVKDRKEEYDEVATSTDKIIVATYGVAAVGINIPRIFNLVLVEPGKSFVRVIQSIGRGIRRAEDKDFVQIWDVTSSCRFAKRHLTRRKEFYKEAKYRFTMEKLEYL